MPKITYADAGTAALAEEMRRDPTVFEFCTDATESLLDEFGPVRIRTTPITENTFTGMAVGAAGSGYRPVVNWRQVTFGFVAMDPIVNQACKIHYMFGGQQKFPITFRAAVGGGTKLAAQHSQSPYSMFMNLGGVESHPAVDTLRHEGPPEGGDPRRQSSDVVRIESTDGPRRRCAGRGLHRAHW